MEHGEPPSTRFVPGRLAGLVPRIDLAEPLTPSLVPALILGTSALAALIGTGVVVVAFAIGLWPGLLALAVVPFVVLGVIALGRVLGELALVLLDLHRDVSGIAARIPAMEAIMDEVAEEIPRLGFLKLLSGSRDRG